MGLWIRSQDRCTLQKITKLYAEKYPIEGCYGIYDLPEDADEVTLGYYTSEKKVLEILDEIQDLLEDNAIAFDDDGYPTLLKNNVVYVMPREG